MKTLIDQKEQRIVIGKFRKVAEATGLTFEHERLRKTKERPVDVNTYRLVQGDQIVAEVTTGVIGIAIWAANLAKIIRANR